MSDDIKRLEAVMGGIFLTLASAMPERAGYIAATLADLIADPRTGEYERDLYRDLADCFELVTPRPADDFDFLSLH